MVHPFSKHSIAFKLILALIFFSSLITLLITAGQLYRDYRLDLSMIDQRLGEVEEVHVANISRSLWVADRQELKLILDGILRIPDMQYIEVSDGSRLWASAGADSDRRVIIRELPLTYFHRGQELEIGRPARAK